MGKSYSQDTVGNAVTHTLTSHGTQGVAGNKMGAIVIICPCGSDQTLHARTVEVDIAIYEHVFVCKDCETTMVFRNEQILSAKSDPDCLV